MDKGYDNPTGHQAVEVDGYPAHIRRIGEEKLDARRAETLSRATVVSGAHLGLAVPVPGGLVRYDRKMFIYITLIQLACARLWYNRQWQLKS